MAVVVGMKILRIPTVAIFPFTNLENDLRSSEYFAFLGYYAASSGNFYPRNNYCSLRNNPEERSSHLRRRESLQSRKFSLQFVGRYCEYDLPPLQNSLAHIEFLVSYCY